MIKKRSRKAQPSRVAAAALDALIDEIATDANGDDEQLWAFRQAFEDNIALPAEGSIVGEPVVVLAFDYDGNERRGLTAKCRGADGRAHEVAAADVIVTPDSPAWRYLAAYRKWMGLVPCPPASRSKRDKSRPTAERRALDGAGPVDLVVLAVKEKAARCRILRDGGEITLRATRLWDVVPGVIAVVRPRKQWRYAGNPYLSGEIESTRLDVAALGLVPLKLEERGVWDPAEQYWGEEGDPIADWAKPIIARGRRPEFEMEQVLPGMDPENADPE